MAVLGLALRVWWGLWADHPPVSLYDPARYLAYGQVIADGHGFIEPITSKPTAYYPPGYPWFVGIVTWLSRPLTEHPLTAVVLVQAGLGASTVVFGAIVARRLAGRAASVVAAAVLALYPNLVFHSGAALSETLYNALFMAFAAVVCTTRWENGIGPRRVAAGAALLGLAIMVRPISLAVVPVLMVTWWVASRDRRVVLRSTAVLVGVLAAVILPWTIRNAIRMQEFVLISNNTGENLCIGHAEGVTGAFDFPDTCSTEESILDGPGGEVSADREKLRVALEAIRADPEREPWLLWRRFWFTWIRDGDHDGLNVVQSYRLDRWMPLTTEARLLWIADRTYWLVAVTGVVGLVRLGLRRRPGDLFLLGSTVMTAAVPLLFFGDSRFKVPAIPLLIVASATLVQRPATE